MEVSEKDKQEFESFNERQKLRPNWQSNQRPTKLLIHGLNQKIVVDASLAELRRSWKKTLGGES